MPAKAAALVSMACLMHSSLIPQCPCLGDHAGRRCMQADPGQRAATSTVSKSQQLSNQSPACGSLRCLSRVLLRVCTPCARQVYGLYLGLLLGALNKLPLKLPRRGAGRRHAGSAAAQATITFDDVAGVDEAKEELSEIVVPGPLLSCTL